MGGTSCIVGLVTVTLLLLLNLGSLATAAAPPYKCFSYLASSNANRSHDKSETGQPGEAAKCPGELCTAIEPTGDIIRQVGDSYEAYCLFDSDYVNASDVSFGYRSGDKFNRFPHQVVNASAIKINVKTEEPKSYDLWCALREKYHLCSRIVKVGYPPENVQNFTCLSKNWSNLNCTWTVPDNPVKVLYSVTECPRKTHYETSCFWDKNLFDLNVKDEIVLHFNATNKLKEDGVIFKYKVNIPESVLPNPVERLTALVDGSHNVTLTWILPHPMDTFGLVLCEAAYRQRLDGDVLEDVPWMVVDRWRVQPDRWSPGETFNRTINNLLPYIQYDFRVRIHTGFGEVRPHMWSEAAILTKRTYPSNPTVEPKTTSGTFEVEETLSYRDIYILWQIVDPLYYNGRNFHYNISAYDDKSNRLIAKDSAEVDIKESYAKFSNMEKDLTYRFEIIPVNDEGPPLNANVRAIVMVPGKAELLTQPTFFKVIAYSEANKTVYSMKWRVDDADAQGVETVTLYWCKKIKYEERCQDKLEWEIIEDPGLNVKNITHLDETALYMFGISVNSAHSSSGIKWLTCIASFGNHPPPLEHFSVSEVTSTEVYLEWSLDCKAKAAEPIGFNISYCAVAGDAQKCPVDAEKSYESINDETALQHVVHNLHPYTKYIFNIAILTQIGLSKWSKSVHVETEPDKPSGPPQDFKVIESGQSWILLSWKLPMATERNGKIIKYKLSWESSYGPKEESVSASSSSEITEHKVTELDPFTKYNFKVTACTEIKYTDVLCGNYSSEVLSRTKIGAPSKVDDISQMDEYVKWEHECSNGPACFYQLLYTVNSTEHIHETEENAASINIRDLNITCTKEEKDITIKLRAVTYNESEQKLFGPWKEESVTCYLTGVHWWIVVTIVAVASLIVIIILVVGRYSWDMIKQFLVELKLKPVLPPGFEDTEPRPRSKNSCYKEIWTPARDSISHEKQKAPCSGLQDETTEPECEDLIPPGGERTQRNLSGDSGTSETDPGDSSGCSTGGESDSSSATDRHHPSSDSGTVQEETGFHLDRSKWVGSGSLRLRTPGPPYVRQGLPDGINAGYVSASSVPNLAVGMSDGSMSLHPFTPNGALGTLPEMPLGARTSTGYISMPDADADTISLDVLNNLTLPHEGRQAGFPAYSRHNFPYKKTTPEMSPYIKTGSLPWLNTGYVAVAQAEGGRPVTTPPARGYVAVSDAMGVMKRQPSLPSLPTGFTKSVSTPDEDLPPGAYCRVGSRSSPGPPLGASAGYVGITQALPVHTSHNSVTAASPTNKAPYVTCAIAESLVSPSSSPEKVKGAYVSVGDFSGTRWAHPVIQRDTGEEGREVASAPVESSRGRPSVPTRPSTSDATVNHNRGGSRWPPLAPSLSKQSSGYVSQETLTFHDPVVMSPKRLLAQSHEPHSVVLSANHKASMV
ncbi:cytokine receptor-like isoform X2 [Macrobrachium nipponense]|uniref:cytokine receptor-like isoform X2 n=1 Tax=Macrobrachium nipponense TaxID=159736 RepID=UPI0030C81574